MKLRQAKERTWNERPPADFKYIDDQINTTTVNMRTVAAVEAQGSIIKDFRAVKAESVLHHITERAKEKGMHVNEAKTALMCVTGANSYEARAHILGADGKKIIGTDRLSFLGVTLDCDGSMRSHIDKWFF